MLSFVLALATFIGISYWRSQPAFMRDFYAMESGAWLADQWEHGFWYCLTHERADYLTAANQIVIGVADGISSLQAGHHLSLSGPYIQHWVATVYVAIIFLGVWAVLKRQYGHLPALALTAVTFMMPDADSQHFLFGEASNVGYFSSLAVVFVYYDALVSETVSTRRLLIGVLVVVLSIFTSPMAALASAGLGLLWCVKLRLSAASTGQPVSENGPRMTAHKPKSRMKLVCIVQGIIILLCIGVIVRGMGINPYADRESATMEQSFADRFVELLFGRQIAYPLLLHWYRDCTDFIAVTVSLVLFMIVSGIAWFGWRRNRSMEKTVFWWTAPALMIIALCMGAATLVARKAMLVEVGQPYSMVQSRYYLVQNMLVILAVGMTLLHLVRLIPRTRIPVIVGFTLVMADFANIQSTRLSDYREGWTPRDSQRTWRAGISRALGLQTLVGDWQEALTRADDPGLALTTVLATPINRLPVPFAMLRDVWPDGKLPEPDDWSVNRAESSAMKLGAKPWAAGLEITNVALCGRRHGLLVLIDLNTTDVRVAAEARHLWIAGAPESAAMKVHSFKAQIESQAYTRTTKQRENWLLQLALFLPKGTEPAAVQLMLADLRIAAGKKPEEAMGITLPLTPRTPQGWTSLQTDDAFALRLFKLKELCAWQPGPTLLTAHNITASGADLTLPGIDDLPFDAQAYLDLNPDVDLAVTNGASASARAHYDAFGRSEKREAARRSITMDLALPVACNEVEGIEFTLRLEDRKTRPSALHVALIGEGSERVSLILIPVEATKEAPPEFRAYFLRDALQWPSFKARKLELIFTGMPKGGKLRVQAMRLLGRS